eukprot:TRINITY_DN70670_c0_g1_i1.p1 TRINITY_DN70670_c0_g1~~TRINITY_DN70670_c0_g1_i1.p1  ORF type:complete len:957 (+),score=250.27 TRINITY_DN70670_c0_g1_i1:79-2871(+)
MPVVEVSDNYKGGLKTAFDVLFGSELFYEVHTADGHQALRCGSWGEDQSGKCVRDVGYTLPEQGVLKVLRQGPTQVSVRETAEIEEDRIVVVSVASNKGGNLAESTCVSVTFTLTPRAPEGTLAHARVEYSFVASRLVRGMVESGMASEMREGYRKLLQAGLRLEQRKLAEPPPPAAEREPSVIPIRPAAVEVVPAIPVPPPGSLKASIIRGQSLPTPKVNTMLEGDFATADVSNDSAAGPYHALGGSIQGAGGARVQNLTFQSAASIAQDEICSAIDDDIDAHSAKSDGDDGAASDAPVSEETVPCCDTVELRRMTRITASVMLAVLSGVLPQIADVVMLGHLDRGGTSGTEHAGAAAAGLLWMHATGFVPYRCVATALREACAAARGAGNTGLCGEWLQLAVCLTLALCIVVGALWVPAGPVLGWLLGISDEQQHLAARYVHYSLIGLVPQCLYSALIAYDQAMSSAWAPALCGTLTAGAQLGLAYLLIWGAGGWAGLGFIGAPVASSVFRWVELLGYGVFVRLRKRRRLRLPPWRARAVSCRRLQQLGHLLLPLSAAAAAEDLQLHAVTLIAARSGSGPQYIAVHWCLATMMSVLGSLLIGLHAATRTRVAHLLSQGSARKAKVAAIRGMLASAVLGFGVLAAALSASDRVANALRDKPSIRHAAEDVSPAAAVAVASLALSHAATATLLALGRQREVALSYILGAWVVTIPLGAVLALKTDRGLRGAWEGVAAGQLVFLAGVSVALATKASFSAAAETHKQAAQGLVGLLAVLSRGTQLVSFAGPFTPPAGQGGEGGTTYSPSTGRQQQLSEGTFAAPTVLFNLQSLIEAPGGGGDAQPLRPRPSEAGSFVVAARPGGAVSALLSTPAAAARIVGGPGVGLLWATSISVSYSSGALLARCRRPAQQSTGLSQPLMHTEAGAVATAS